MTVLSDKLTGRGWGDKLPFRVISSREDESGRKLVTYEADLWEGPTKPGQKGQYRRIRTEVSNLTGISPSCSFYSELKKALGA